MVGGDAFGFGFEIQNQPVPQRRQRDRLDVVEADIEATLGQRADLGGENQRLPAARAAAEAEVLIGDRRREFCNVPLSF